jgi:glycosyltransferase involved in cell wall biosynthesis
MALHGKKITAIIPALNEEKSIALVLNGLPGFIDNVVVCDNGSTDNTAAVARQQGAAVVFEKERGYGAACLRAVAALDSYGTSAIISKPDILLFIDGDYSDYPEQAETLIRPLIENDFDLVMGSRILTLKSHRALFPAAVLGNWLSTKLIYWIWNAKFTDIGPFRAIKFDSFKTLDMKDRNFGWTLEMQVKAVKRGLKCLEVPVSYRKRIGSSKISGTISGSLRAGTKFIWIICKEAFFS